MSLFCTKVWDTYLKEAKKKKNHKTKCKQQMCGKRGTERRKAKRMEEQFMEYISKFRCKTNPVI